ncbi:MFS transporter [Nitrospirillum sp. BR 11828]|uniref:MFS transporter n=1 Tax=Nitrospirillum sp. BR 11828 TaxID=3104325 RepID=UPI002ACA409F|nr:MFS transporter [Nitrospirillum sp. BR 11828]MDZ5650393.1 MFS transporter [Nitrospirillum sp. BR 11828]
MTDATVPQKSHGSAPALARRLARRVDGRMHYGWVAAALAFTTLLVGAGVRAAPGVLFVPLEQALGWDRATIAAAVSLNIFLYGFMGPFAAALMQAVGVRRTILTGLGLLAVTTITSTLMTQPWQMMLSWGLLVGLGTGLTSMTLAATVVNRWFIKQRGLVMGLLTASSATGQLVFLPGMAALATHFGWQAVGLAVGAAALALAPLVALLLPDSPRAVGLAPVGGTLEDELPPFNAQGVSGNPIVIAFTTLARASKSVDFWLLFGSFFVCGLSTNGLIGTHLISACFDQGIPEVMAASLLALMGLFDLVGTTGSGWLSDRVDSRKLLFWYYGLRGLSLFYLPLSGFSLYGLSVFAAFYGLDWIATVPPTLRLVTDRFGRRDAPVVFGWVGAGHQMGAALAAYGTGLIRTEWGSYFPAFQVAGVACVLTAIMVLFINRRRGGAALSPAE